jgi:hypothetical protein
MGPIRAAGLKDPRGGVFRDRVPYPMIPLGTPASKNAAKNAALRNGNGWGRGSKPLSETLSELGWFQDAPARVFSDEAGSLFSRVEATEGDSRFSDVFGVFLMLKNADGAPLPGLPRRHSGRFIRPGVIATSSLSSLSGGLSPRGSVA